MALVGSKWTDTKGRTWEVIEMAWPGVYRARTTDRTCVVEMQASAIRRAVAASQHSPGPWTVEAPPAFDYGASMAVMAPGKTHTSKLYVAEVFKTDDDIPRMTQDVQGLANARLIATAPDLLATAESVLESLARNLADDFLPETREALRAVIAKARGC